MSFDCEKYIGFVLFGNRFIRKVQTRNTVTRRVRISISISPIQSCKFQMRFDCTRFQVCVDSIAHQPWRPTSYCCFLKRTALSWKKRSTVTGSSPIVFFSSWLTSAILPMLTNSITSNADFTHFQSYNYHFYIRVMLWIKITNRSKRSTSSLMSTQRKYSSALLRSISW